MNCLNLFKIILLLVSTDCTVYSVAFTDVYLKGFDQVESMPNIKDLKSFTAENSHALSVIRMIRTRQCIYLSFYLFVSISKYLF